MPAWIHPLPAKTVAQRIAGALFLFIGLLLGAKPLQDVDLGWHLAGGLWMLQHQQIPLHDPFGAEGNFWWCYSWLFEAVVAGVFHVGGFGAVRLLQHAAVVALVFSIWWFAQEVSARQQEAGNTRQHTSAILAAALCVILVSPFLHLRPQLLSLLFAMASVVCIRHGKFLALVLIAVVWANIHVFWVFVPLSYAVLGIAPWHGQQKQKVLRLGLCTLVLAAAGLANPYGVVAIEGLVQYAFEHRYGYAIIQEFRPIGAKDGLILVLTAVCATLVAGCAFQESFRKQFGFGYISLSLVFALAAWVQVKYIALFAVLASPLVAGAIVQLLDRSFGTSRAELPEQVNAPSAMVLLILGCVAAVVAAVPVPTLTPKIQSLLDAVAAIDSSYCATDKTIVLNHFDDGGWLNFGLYRLCPEKKTLPVRSSIDGRSLVMGEKRLEQFWQLMANKGKADEVIADWNPQLAIVSRKRKFLRRQLLDRPDAWEHVADYGEFALFRRSYSAQVSTSPTPSSN